MVSKGDNVRALFLLLLGPSPSGQSGILPLSAQILHGTPKCHITRLCMDMDNSCHHVYDSRSHWWIPYSCVSFILDLWFLNIPSCAVFWSSMDIKLWYWKSYARAWTKKTLSVNILRYTLLNQFYFSRLLEHSRGWSRTADIASLFACKWYNVVCVSPLHKRPRGEMPAVHSLPRMSMNSDVNWD